MCLRLKALIAIKSRELDDVLEEIVSSLVVDGRSAYLKRLFEELADHLNKLYDLHARLEAVEANDV